MSKLIKKNGNPQGKGIAGVVVDLHSFSPLQVQAKNSLQWLADYFTSTLVLGAKYGFKPVVDKSYYLYFKDNDWKLSLIEPSAWRTCNPGFFFAECVLNSDMSWSVVLEPGWQKNSILVKVVTELEHAFIQGISDSTCVIDKLPFFMQSLNYYQRVGANALARSLQASLELSVGKRQSQGLSGVRLLSGLTASGAKLLEYSAVK